MGATDYRGIVMYDDTCGLCNRSVQFLLRIDRRQVLQFAPLQGETAAAVLARHDLEPDLDTVVYVRGVGLAEEAAYTHSTAAWRLWHDIGGRWRVAAWLLRIVPRPLRDWGYRLIASHRHQIPAPDACGLPPAGLAEDRFLP